MYVQESPSNPALYLPRIKAEEARETDMIAEAVTIEAVWAIEPELFASFLGREINNFLAEKVPSAFASTPGGEDFALLMSTRQTERFLTLS